MTISKSKGPEEKEFESFWHEYPELTIGHACLLFNLLTKLKSEKTTWADSSDAAVSKVRKCGADVISVHAAPDPLTRCNSCDK